MRPTAWSKEQQPPTTSQFKVQTDFSFTRLESRRLQSLLTDVHGVISTEVDSKTITVVYSTQLCVNDLPSALKIVLYEFAYNNPDLPQEQVARMTVTELAAHLKAGLRPAQV